MAEAGMEKKAGKQKRLLKTVLLEAACTVFFLAMQIVFMLMADEVMHYFRIKDTAVPVDAVITRVTKHVDSDDSSDEDYRLYVSYTYEEIAHVDVPYKTEEDMPAEGFSGKTVEIRVDPKHPHIILTEPWAAWMAFAVTLLFVYMTSSAGMGTVYRGFRDRHVLKDRQRIYAGDTLTRLQVQEDMDIEAGCVRRYKLWAILASTVLPLVAMLPVIGRLNCTIYAQILLMGHVLAVVTAVHQARSLIRHSKVTELRLVHRVDYYYRGEYRTIAGWVLEPYGKWRANDMQFVDNTGRPWSDEYPLEDYWIALNDKGKILRVFPADMFSAVDNH